MGIRSHVSRLGRGEEQARWELEGESQAGRGDGEHRSSGGRDPGVFEGQQEGHVAGGQ